MTGVGLVLPRLLLLWLFRQGPRISDALKVRGEKIDLKRRWRAGTALSAEGVDPSDSPAYLVRRHFASPL